jgi:hypothetical protein
MPVLFTLYDNKLTCKTNTVIILMHQTRISTTQVSSVMLRSKKLEIRKKGKTERAVGWTPECHEFESNPSKDRAMPEGDNPSFCDELWNLLFSLDSSIHIRILKQVPKYLATGL